MPAFPFVHVRRSPSRRLLTRSQAGLLVSLLAFSAVVVWSSDARAGRTTTLSLSGYNDMVVDDSRGQVFVSGGSGNSSILAMNYDGTLAGTVSNVPGGAGMVLSGSTLYVARKGGAGIDVVDASTLSVSRTISLPSSTNGSLALAGGKLWIGAGACGSWMPLAAVNPSTGATTSYGSPTYYCPTFATSPTDPNLLLVADLGLSPATVDKYDVSTSPPTLVQTKRDPGGGTSNLQDMVVTADGSKLLIAAGYPYLVKEYRLSDLEPSGTAYSTGPYPTAVALAGGHVAAGADASYNPDVFIFSDGNSTAIRSYDFAGSAAPTLAPGGLAFTPNADRLFAVTMAHGSSTREFHVLDGPSLPGTPLSLSASASRVAYNKTVMLNVHIDVPGAPLFLYKTPHGGTKTLVAEGTADANGNASFSSAMTKKSVFVAEFEGDPSHGSGVSNAVTVEVIPRVSGSLSGYYGSSGKYRLFRYTSKCPNSQVRCPAYTATVAPNPTGAAISFRLQHYRNGAWRTEWTQAGTVPGGGSLTLVLIYRSTAVKGVPYRVRVEFAGDADRLPKNSAWAYFKITS